MTRIAAKPARKVCMHRSEFFGVFPKERACQYCPATYLQVAQLFLHSTTSICNEMLPALFFSTISIWNEMLPSLLFLLFFQQLQFVIMKCCDPFCFCFSTTTTKYVFTLYLSRGMYYRVFDESWKKEDLKVFILGLAFLWGTLSMSKLKWNSQLKIVF